MKIIPLVLSVLLFGFMLGSVVESLGTVQPAYTVKPGHVTTCILICAVFFFGGYFSRGNNDV